ncbi:MAG TPA: hypothetical protein VGN37_25790 [Actinocatenispora sp.]
MDPRIEDRLRDELDAHVRDVRVPPRLFDAALRRHRRRRASLATVGSTAAVAAVAVGTVALVPPHTPGGTRAVAPTVAGSPSLETVAAIRPRLIAALDASHAIVRTTARSDVRTFRVPPGPFRATAPGPTPSGTAHRQVNENWFDPDTGYFTVYTYDDGRHTSTTRYPQWQAGTMTVVEYGTRRYYVEPVAATTPPPEHATGKAGEPVLDTVQGIRAAVQRPDIRIVGHDTVDGRPTTHLRFSVTASGDTVTGDAWFDARTYVPLRATTTYGRSIRITTRFLPRTAASLAKTRLAIPPGFHRAAAPTK